MQVLWIDASFTQGVWVFAKTTGQPPGMRWHHAAEAFDGARISSLLPHRIARVLHSSWVDVARTLFVGLPRVVAKLRRLNRTSDGCGGHSWVDMMPACLLCRRAEGGGRRRRAQDFTGSQPGHQAYRLHPGRRTPELDCGSGRGPPGSPAQQALARLLLCPPSTLILHTCCSMSPTLLCTVLQPVQRRCPGRDLVKQTMRMPRSWL